MQKGEKQIRDPLFIGIIDTIEKAQHIGWA